MDPYQAINITINTNDGWKMKISIVKTHTEDACGNTQIRECIP